MVATSDDLVHWDKQGPAFGGTRHARRWSKSGAVVTEVVGGRLRAARVDGRFLMYWGEGTCFMATSDDLVHWEPVEAGPEDDRYVTRDPGAAVGSLGLRIHRVRGARVLRAGARSASRPLRRPPGRAGAAGPVGRDRHRARLQRRRPPARRGHVSAGVRRLRPPRARFGRRPLPGEAWPPGGSGCLEGQVDDVCFAQGLVLHEGRWILYLGLADSRVGYATAPPPRPLGLAGPDRPPEGSPRPGPGRPAERERAFRTLRNSGTRRQGRPPRQASWT